MADDKVPQTGTLTLRFQKGRLLSSEVNGLKGPDCLEETKRFLDGLGINKDDFKDENKKDMDEMPQAQHQGQG
jgi:hypothetical protein